MATNVFFRNYDNFNEQQLIDDLVIESIRMYGVDIIYIKRSITGRDDIFNEDDMPLYDETFHFECYVKNVDGFEGEGDFLSKFGLQIRDSVTFSVANRTFERFVTRELPEMVRPREGDLIYFPLNEKMFEIKFVEHESVFYQSGALQVSDMKAELIEFSGQRFETGREAIDNYFDEIDTTQTDTLQALANTTGDQFGVTDGADTLARNYVFETEGDNIVDFSESDPFSENITIQDS
jgi:hypothetical protein